jgi:hypothetical protein
LSLLHGLLIDRYILHVTCGSLEIAGLTVSYQAMITILGDPDFDQGVMALQHIHGVFCFVLFPSNQRGVASLQR